MQKRWNEINLYTMTRGINRFKGLGLALLEVDKQYKPIEGITQLLQYTDIILSQAAGSKSYCIKRLREKGYEKSRVLMIGDAPGDLGAALENKVLYFPILVGREGESWKRLTEEGLARFWNHTFDEAYQEQVIREFQENLQ